MVEGYISEEVEEVVVGYREEEVRQGRKEDYKWEGYISEVDKACSEDKSHGICDQ